MANIFQNLIITICSVTIIREVFELIIPSGKINGFVSMVIGLSTSLVIIQKIIDLVQTMI